ncbi:hypothetical protein AL542_00770 [Grimontia hollisae]|uniref:Uncharacterized protein n=1 Tax=Grimontia hollisae CIP 101886 TaxID=675812 RepID=D0I9P7_GRIHO|nr:hypothetical protein [Grimontia hollisae]AMG29016.1 hypothetical protein AL542_00770 [Grimontia hollisae]EEY71762.1 hypothetical protein VHA_002184 [Grimontia hollisae CIP 101886]MDF2186696.1 hypothetical protein [Grimontia hollisae]STO77062.1 Uncharacterised protein [Grimontia hollisae]
MRLRKRYALPAVLFSLYFLNVIATKIQIISGTTSIVRVGDVGEFLLLLFASLTFVVAMLSAEREAESHSTGLR